MAITPYVWTVARYGSPGHFTKRCPTGYFKQGEGLRPLAYSASGTSYFNPIQVRATAAGVAIPQAIQDHFTYAQGSSALVPLHRDGLAAYQQFADDLRAAECGGNVPAFSWRASIADADEPVGRLMWRQDLGAALERWTCSPQALWYASNVMYKSSFPKTDQTVVQTTVADCLAAMVARDPSDSAAPTTWSESWRGSFGLNKTGSSKYPQFQCCVKRGGFSIDVSGTDGPASGTVLMGYAVPTIYDDWARDWSLEFYDATGKTSMWDLGDYLGAVGKAALPTSASWISLAGLDLSSGTVQVTWKVSTDQTTTTGGSITPTPGAPTFFDEPFFEGGNAQNIAYSNTAYAYVTSYADI